MGFLDGAQAKVARAVRSLLSGDERWRSLGALAAFGCSWARSSTCSAPMLDDFSTYGFHDWDVETAYRYITVVSLREHGEGPWWHPYMCGGVPAWGHVEGASNLVSPYLPLYLLSDVRTAIRLEVLGQGLVGLAGTYLFAGCFTRSIALRALLAALFVLNGRWALQAAGRPHLAPPVRPDAVGLLLFRALAGSEQAQVGDRSRARHGAPVLLGRHLPAAAHGAAAFAGTRVLTARSSARRGARSLALADRRHPSRSESPRRSCSPSSTT